MAVIRSLLPAGTIVIMRFRLLAFRLALAFTLVIPTAVLAEEAGAKRPLRLDDFFDTEELGTPVFSPDGHAIAFTRRRAASSQLTTGLLIPETRDDVWVQLGDGQPVRNLTKGAADSSGWWDPQWSPDGQRLTFLSSRGGNVTVWTWDRRTDKVRQLSTDGIAFALESSGCRWVDNRQTLCLALPEGERSTPTGPGVPFEYNTGKGAELAMVAWEKARRGEVTASAVNSLEFVHWPRRLVLLDLETGASRLIGTTLQGLGTTSWWLSSDGKTVAFVQDRPSTYARRYRAAIGFPCTIGLRRLDGTSLSLDQHLPTNVLASSLAWSPDGSELALYALKDSKPNPTLLYGEEGAKEVVHESVTSLENPARLWRIDVRKHTVAQIDTGDIDLGRDLVPPRFSWMISGELLFRATLLRDRSNTRSGSEPRWWVLGRDGHTRALMKDATASNQVPTTLEAIDDASALVGISGNDVWRIDSRNGRVENLTADFAPPVHQLHIQRTPGHPHAAIVLRAGVPIDDLSRWALTAHQYHRATGVGTFLLDSTTGRVSEIGGSTSTAVLIAVHPATGTAIHKVDSRAGTSLWRKSPSAEPRKLLEMNTFRQDIRRVEQRIIEYRGLNGELLTAKLTLPLDYAPGRKYPLVVDSDIGYVYETTRTQFVVTPDAPPAELHIAEGGLFAAAGYAYLFASIPVNAMDEAGRANLLTFTTGLLPAVQRVVDDGVADPDRVFLFGWSSFGYGALAVATQTARFRAVVAGASWSDQITSSLSVGLASRYSLNPFDTNTFGAYYSNRRLPFWRNSEHLRRNSPLSYVDRIRTPILLIQGDQDVMPLSEQEMLFSALAMQRKPAQFVRYWGEGHILRAPANIRDMYQRIFAWFDDFGDISRNGSGAILFDGDRVRSRGTNAPLKPEAFTHFGPAASPAVASLSDREEQFRDRPYGRAARKSR